MWTVVEEDGSTFCLKKVLEYRYLGVQTFETFFKTVNNWQARAVTMANMYKWAYMKLSCCGPDAVILGQLAWCAVASPSIRFGCDTITFTDTHINSIECCQSQLFKNLLFLNTATPNIAAQTEFGVQFFRHQLYVQQLSFYTRVLLMDKSRWPYLALMEHLKRPHKSPYFRYIHKIRTEL